jgi:hypothetical protein
MIVFDDADIDPLTFAGAGARPAALRTYEQVSQSWNARLFVCIDRNSRDDRHQSALIGQSLAEHDAELLESVASEMAEMAENAIDNGWPKEAQGIEDAVGRIEEKIVKLRDEAHEPAAAQLYGGVVNEEEV